MKQGQDLLEQSLHVLEQAGELIDRTQPILKELVTFLAELSDLRAKLNDQCRQLQHHLSGLETASGMTTVADTPLPDRNGTLHYTSNLDPDPSINIEEEPELPSMSVSLAEFELPWERSKLIPAETAIPSPRKVAQPDRPPSNASVGSERRGSPRRPGNPTSVSITIGEDVFSGWVVDRSPLGVGMLVDDALEAGTMILIRPNAAPSDCPSVEGEVRHCQPEKGQYRVGCKFSSTLSWQHLRYFG